MNLNDTILSKLKHFCIHGITSEDIEAFDFDDASKIIDELHLVYLDRHKYDINYAYSNAHKKITAFYDDFMDKFELEKEKYEGSDSENHQITGFVDRLYRHVAHLHINYKRLNLLMLGSSLIFSLGLILTVHWLTDHFIHRFETLIDSFVIILILGIVKLFIEERLIRERLEKREWAAYIKNIELTKNNFAKVILSYLLLRKANETHSLLRNIVGEHKKLLHSLHKRADFE